MKPSVAVAGMGYWGKNLVRNLHEIGVLNCICDQDSSRKAQVLEKYPDVKFLYDFGDVLDDETIDAVVIATPAASHYGMAHAALNAGKDVFVEKPLALDVGEGEELVRLAEKQGRILMVGHILQYHPAVIKLKELIENGELGHLRYFYSNRLSMGKIRTEENILWSFAPHDISVMLALLDDVPTQITCQGGSYLNQDVADVTMSQFAFHGGVRAHIFVNWLHPFKEQRMVVVGSEKMAVFEDTSDDKLVLYQHRVEWKKRIPMVVKAEGQKIDVETSEPLRAECEHFLSCIENRTAPISDGVEGLAVLKVLHACQESLETGEKKICAENDLQNLPEKDTRPEYFAHESAFVDDGAVVGPGTKIWHFSHIMKGVRIGENCIFGQNCNVDGGVVVGSNVKVQNNVSIYSGAVIENDVFLGPSCVLTNVTNPRSQINRHALYETTTIKRGATIGANATIVCGVTIGRYAFVAAGAVVTSDIPDYGLVMGNPAKMAGWMSRHGHRLMAPDKDGFFVCPESGFRYQEIKKGVLRCLDVGEEEELPNEHRAGENTYQSFKKE